ncbi:universal stress protein [Niabella drilacis]|uniref:Nucleotide-binding universal stress protein, UspA family n=1 Tax=Niabella drilacis (strain DSM 25811 / CCM 8410 / CCUG 62505 / LMG 26954 / E90) TaxID=1285928 RepID=A0A1G6RC47_NIADE|nr:universal stress protein [Niabella drilacis]SDD02118.1 Nucleotide-binding universal stress protein, UspA family [Niabella drilacis]
MKTIIAATNFSATANHAVAFAADLAQLLKARLIIFNAVDILPVTTDVQVPLDFYEVAEEQADALLTDLVLEMKKRTKNEIVIEALYKVGTVVNQLELLCGEEEPVAVFIASEFVTAFERILWGTHSIPIAKRSSCPVVVVPATATLTDFKKIGIAIDLEGDDPVPWAVLRDWLRQFRAEIDIVAVSPNAELSPREVPLTIDVQEQLDSFKPHYRFLANDHVEEGIREYVAEQKPDLLIMFVQRHGFFHKSVTKSFILSPPVPVLFMSPKVK